MVERRRTFWQRALAGRTNPAKPDPATVTVTEAAPAALTGGMVWKGIHGGVSKTHHSVQVS